MAVRDLFARIAKLAVRISVVVALVAPVAAVPAQAQEFAAMRISLPPPSSDEKAAATAAAAKDGVAAPLAIGIGRALPKSRALLQLDSLAWTADADGSWRTSIELQSTGAAALRLGLPPQTLPKGLSIAARSMSNKSSYGPYNAADLRPKHGTQSDPTWLPAMDGDTVRLELRAASKAALTGRTMRLPLVSHQPVSPEFYDF
jgi:hypothetical protein